MTISNRPAMRAIRRRGKLWINAVVTRSTCAIYYFARQAQSRTSSALTTSEETGDTVSLASYRSPRSDNSDLLNATTIWQACRATSAATTFFDPIAIGPFDEEFVDDALGANNPVYAL